MALLDFAVSPSGPDGASNFGTGEPSLTCRSTLWQHHVAMAARKSSNSRRPTGPRVSAYTRQLRPVTSDRCLSPQNSRSTVARCATGRAPPRQTAVLLDDGLHGRQVDHLADADRFNQQVGRQHPSRSHGNQQAGGRRCGRAPRPRLGCGLRAPAWPRRASTAPAAPCGPSRAVWMTCANVFPGRCSFSTSSISSSLLRRSRSERPMPTRNHLVPSRARRPRVPPVLADLQNRPKPRG